MAGRFTETSTASTGRGCTCSSAACSICCQQQALDRIENRAGLCLIRDPELLSFWRGFSPPANDGRLLRFVRERFGTLRDFGGYRFGLETGRTGTVSP